MKVSIENGKIIAWNKSEVFPIVTPEMAIGIIDRLKAKGYTFTAIAKRIGVTLATIKHWRNVPPKSVKPAIQLKLRKIEQEEFHSFDS